MYDGMYNNCLGVASKAPVLVSWCRRTQEQGEGGASDEGDQGTSSRARSNDSSRDSSSSLVYPPYSTLVFQVSPLYARYGVEH